jgi:hypothetical protein
MLPVGKAIAATLSLVFAFSLETYSPAQHNLASRLQGGIDCWGNSFHHTLRVTACLGMNTSSVPGGSRDLAAVPADCHSSSPFR